MTRAVYTGISDGMGGRVFVTRDDSLTKPLDPRLDLMNHSPTGFAWGYGGSGPAQLALAILADHLGSIIDTSHEASRAAVEKAAIRLHQDFKWRFVATWSQRNNFVLESEDIDLWLGARGE